MTILEYENLIGESAKVKKCNGETYSGEVISLFYPEEDEEDILAPTLVLRLTGVKGRLEGIHISEIVDCRTFK